MSAVEQTTSGLNGGNKHEEASNNSSKKERKRKRRWGDASKPAAAGSATTTAEIAPTPTPTLSSGPLDSKAKALALKASVAVRLAALKAKTAGTTATTAVPSSSPLKRPAPSGSDDGISAPSSAQPAARESHRPVKRAKVYELDMSVTGPTFRSRPGAPKPKINPYLAHRQPVKLAATTVVNDDDKGGTALQKEPSKTSVATEEGNDDYDDYVDERLEHTAAASRRQRKELSFVEPGTFVEIAERKRQRAMNAESAGFVSGRKVGQFVQSTTMISQNYYGTTEILDSVTDLGVLPPRAETVADDSKSGGGSSSNKHSSMPLVVEWWDMELLPSKLKKQVANLEGKALSKEAQTQMQQLSTSNTANKDEEDGDGDAKISPDADLPPGIRTLISPAAEDLRTMCMEQASLSYSKTAELIQHIVPIQPPHAKKDGPEAEPVLYLTKKDRKRLRKRQREAKQREQQDLQAAGLIPAPEPRLTLKNFIRVLGDQAYVDPSQMEQKVMDQMQARQRAHLERNESRKLTKQQKAEKLRRKYEEDTSETGVHVALFYVKNLSHPYHRTKVDLNAQQFNITGGVVECQSPQVACVIVEGGPKAIKKYTRLMLVRMKWKGPDNDDDDEEEEEEEEETNEDGVVVKPKFDKDNKCELVWSGMATKRFFKGFVFQACETSDQARKILRSKGVGHYWDQVLSQASGRGESMHLKLADSDDEEESEKEEDLEMTDA